MNLSIYYWIGFATPCVIGIGLYLIINYFRHQCKDPTCCRQTKKVCRLYRLREIQVTPRGMESYAAYIFRVCKKGHVTCRVKLVTLSGPQIAKKPSEESDWGSLEVFNLCRAAGIQRPTTKPPSATFFHQSATRHPVRHISVPTSTATRFPVGK